MEDFPNVNRWFEVIGNRPAVQRALKVGEELRRNLKELDQEARDRLFGRTTR